MKNIFTGNPIGEDERIGKILTCVNNCTRNDYILFKWKFYTMPDYKINAFMTDFVFEIPNKVINSNE
jgi:hypothetical protein